MTDKVKFKNGWVNSHGQVPINLNLAASFIKHSCKDYIHHFIEFIVEYSPNKSIPMWIFDNKEERDRVYNDILAHLFGEGEG